MQRQIVRQGFELLVARDEIRFAEQFDQNADLAAGMRVALDNAFFGRALGRLLGRLDRAFLPKHINCFFHVAAGLFQFLLDVDDAGAGHFADLADG